MFGTTGNCSTLTALTSPTIDFRSLAEWSPEEKTNEKSKKREESKEKRKEKENGVAIC